MSEVIKERGKSKDIRRGSVLRQRTVKKKRETAGKRNVRSNKRKRNKTKT